MRPFARLFRILECLWHFIRCNDFLIFTIFFNLTLMLQLGGILPPRRTFYPVALKPLGIVTKAFVTFPEYMWAKKCWKIFSDISTSISNMAAGKWTSSLKTLENPILRCYLVSKAHKNKIPTAVPMFSGMTFSMAVIFTSPGVAVIPKINMADKKRK